VPFPGLERGKVVTRFPPEASGFMHIGHAKAAMINDFFARYYDGKLIIRFDDTNPTKEREEFEVAIVSDLARIGIKGDVLEYTSDYFPQLFDIGELLINEGKAYADLTPVDRMREMRMKREESEYRSQPVLESLRLFEEMKKGSEEGQKCCIRAKIDMKSNNGSLRDPILFRCNVDTPHARTGTKYKCYPTYDLACPVVDSMEGVTHAFRSSEYSDREPQYYWMCDAVGLRRPFMCNFSRLNFMFTVMSKRKLQWFVDQKIVNGWDDPRFPTVQGVLRRGMTVRALRAFILSQGFSVNSTLMEWDKIWAVNKRVIDPIAPRHTAVAKSSAVTMTVAGAPKRDARAVPKHKKNPDIGTKTVLYADEVLLEAEDAASLKEGEIVTLMDWGNVKIDSVDVNAMRGTFLPDNTDFKKSTKLTWLAKVPEVITVKLIEYDHIITKPKIEEEDNVEDVANRDSEHFQECFGDVNLKLLKVGDIIQFERRGYYICDKMFMDSDAPEKMMTLINIPDGKQAKKK